MQVVVQRRPVPRPAAAAPRDRARAACRRAATAVLGRRRRRVPSGIIPIMALHGELKVPGGKLVVVDVVVEDGHLRQVEVSGDFFLEPAEALDDIVAALDGAPADADEDALARRIAARLRPGAELMGFTPSAVAAAVRRALDDGRPRERA